MGRRNTVISLAVLLICGGILVLFTDLELSAVRWLNCGPWPSQSEHRSRLCH